MNQLKFFFSATVITVMLSCSSTSMISSWHDPNTTIEKDQLKKILVFAFVGNESIRRSAEDAVVKRNPSVFVASYPMFTADMMQNRPEEVNAGIAKENYDAIAIMRLVNKQEKTNYVPGSYPGYYGSWHGYYGYSYSSYYDPGYYQTSDYYSVETNLYTTNPDKLIWSAITSTVDPGSVPSAINEIAEQNYYQMQKDGFLKKGSK